MAVRNSWIECFIDGRQTPICGGPRAKYGGFVMYLYVRENGESVEVIRIEQGTDPDRDTIWLKVFDVVNNSSIYKNKFKR